MEVVGFIALIFLGLVLGTVGMGGSMLAIPILVYVFSLNIVTASGYALFITWATSLAGFALKLRENMTDVRAALLFGIPSLAASFIARRWLVTAIPAVLHIGDWFVAKEDLMLVVLSVVMIVSSGLMILGNKQDTGAANRRRVMLLPAGIFTGTLAGFVGAGGGFMILPSLLVFGRLPLPVAVGTTLVIISFNSLLGFFGDAVTYPIHWPFLLMVTGFCLAGLLIGYALRRGLSRYLNRSLIGCITATIGVAIILIQLLR